MATMDLTPKHSTPWWSILGCCHVPSSSSASSSSHPNDKVGDGDGDVIRFPFAPSFRVTTTGGSSGKVVIGMDGPETPSTACTGSTAGE
jgi:hypothetical protein